MKQPNRIIALLLCLTLVLTACAPSARREARETEAAATDGTNQAATCSHSVEVGGSRPFLMTLLRRAGQFVVSLATQFFDSTLQRLLADSGGTADVHIVMPDGSSVRTTATSVPPAGPSDGGGLVFGTTQETLQSMMDLAGPMTFRFEGRGSSYELSVTAEAWAEMSVSFERECLEEPEED